MLKKKIVVPWVDDSKFLIGQGDTGLTGNLYAGFMEYEDMLFLLHALRPSEIFIDVGANVGAYTILASKIVKSKSIAFEPIENTVERLNDNIYLNRIQSDVEVRNIGVGDKCERLSFTTNGDTINKVSLEGGRETTTVQVTTLDNELIDGQQYFIKIDVEGFEYNVLQGGSKILSSENVVALIVELIEHGQSFGKSNEEIHKKVTDFGYVPVAYDPMNRKVTQISSFNNMAGKNTIYVKDIADIQNRCTFAPKRIVHTAFDIRI